MGIDGYQHVQRTSSAGADAARVAAGLRSAGFQVRELRDPDWAALLDGINTLYVSIAAGDEVVVYFAGLTAETGDDAYLLARDTQIDSLPGIRKRAQSVRAMLGALDLCRPSMTLLLIDGARPAIVGSMWGQPSNLGARWAPELEPGQAVLLAAAADQVASNAMAKADTGPHGLLARELLALLRTRALPISRLIDTFVGAAQQQSATAGPGQRPMMRDRFGANYQLLALARAAAAPSKPDTQAARRIVRDAMRANNGGAELKAAYRAALRAAPDYLPALIGLGMLAEAEGDWLTAINYFERVSILSRAGALPTAATYEARSLRRRLDGEAEPGLLRRIEYEEAVSQARLFLAMSDARAAVGQVERALTLDASRWEAYAVAGEIALALDRLQDARRWFREAFERARGPVRDLISRASQGF